MAYAGRIEAGPGEGGASAPGAGPVIEADYRVLATAARPVRAPASRPAVPGAPRPGLDGLKASLAPAARGGAPPRPAGWRVWAAGTGLAAAAFWFSGGNALF